MKYYDHFNLELVKFVENTAGKDIWYHQSPTTPRLLPVGWKPLDTLSPEDAVLKTVKALIVNRISMVLTDAFMIMKQCMSALD